MFIYGSIAYRNDYNFILYFVFKLICLVIQEADESQNVKKYNSELMQKQIAEKESEMLECKMKLEQASADVTKLNFALKEKDRQVDCLQTR